MIRDDCGTDWIAYHAIDRDQPFLPGTNDEVRRPMLISRLAYENGWPKIKTGSPSTGWHTAPRID